VRQVKFEKPNIGHAALVGQFPCQRQISGIPIDADRFSRPSDPTKLLGHNKIHPLVS
jgi:hypothetical protein